METLKRYLIFLVGLFVNSLGVSLRHPLKNFDYPTNWKER